LLPVENACKQLEKRVGHSVISPAKAKDFLPPGEDVPQIEE
jgi:hypothetical protein